MNNKYLFIINGNEFTSLYSNLNKVVIIRAKYKVVTGERTT